MGTDGNGRYYLDIVDIHRYRFGNSSFSRANVIDDPANVNGSFTSYFANDLSDGSNTGLADRCSTANISRPSSSKLQFSVSELNVCWKNESTNGISDESANSFIAG